MQLPLSAAKSDQAEEPEQEPEDTSESEAPSSEALSDAALLLDEPIDATQPATPAEVAPEALAIAATTGDRSLLESVPSPTDASDVASDLPLPLPGTPPAGHDAALLNPRVDITHLDNLERHLYAHRYARSGIECYSASIDPAAAAVDTGEALATLAQENHELLCSPATGALLERLSHPQAQTLMDATHRAQVRVLKHDRAALVNVPATEQTALTLLTNEAQVVWRKAKQANDWAAFAPYLDRIVESMRRIAGYRKPNASPYDVWLEEHERGHNQTFYDAFFAQVKEVVVPLLADVASSRQQLSKACLHGRFDERRQWELASELLDIEGLRRDALFVTSTEHPFTGSLTTNYAIIASHVYEEDVASNIFSMLHEGGHALYEMGVNPSYGYTSLHGGTSSGMHEAQSRFFENYVGRDEAFAPTLLAVLRKHFPSQFNRVTARQLYLAVNAVEPQPIRTEADELTYPLHVLVRYEIEQLLMAGEATASDVPGLWSKKYREYLGVRVPDDARGALQDSHWSSGAIGYFPTYALGNAYAAQLRHAMIAEGLDWEGALSAGDLAPLRDWLGRNVWLHGRAKDPADIIYDACGESFDARYYTQYLREKFSTLYGL
jgi:carboxypeptidase Taq